MEGKVLPVSGTAKCLSYQWNHDLSAKPSIEYNITKGRKSFFAYGSIGLFPAGPFTSIWQVYDGHMHPTHPVVLVEKLVPI